MTGNDQWCDTEGQINIKTFCIAEVDIGPVHSNHIGTEMMQVL